ncbi:MAG: type I-B CRISPR-associated protein Cas7/Cst2/DevR [Clostridiaceae bacterium]|nr:type I-B CRISPR-associated protein Cas7/Cst2/DevR [Clostridiaceae bacterium]MBW4860695.1 type I-B CRISPR-associated protein Cas7/Cst2/DevR [Clostridiaceae bacterium]MBW4869051.1 type I-B CRISPR-associated protein Cas7/Cst2/DevR [Clostridiaceae bacterium]
MKTKGLTMSIIFEAGSANYGETIGNVASLKKLSRGKGDQYTYISRQALRYNIVNQMGIDNTEVNVDKSVVQFAPDATIDKYPEIDLFGYMKTSKEQKTRSAIVRLSHAISLETFKGDLDFLTNKGLYDRYSKQENKSEAVKGGSIAQSEIHRSYYAYTITADLDKVGIDENDDIEIENTEKADRIINLLDTIRFLYRDIKGRREDLKPLFAIGGVYDIKNPIFHNALDVKNNQVDVNRVKDVLYKDIKEDTYCGLVKGVFENDNEIIKELEAVSMPEYFEEIKKEVKDYYESN